LYFFVEDSETGMVSPMMISSSLYRQKAGNAPPGPVTLISPADNSDGPAPFALDWSDVSDPEGDPIRYTLEVSTDAGFSNIVYIQADLTRSYTIIEEQAELVDLTGYYWRIKSIDAFGGISTSNNFRFIYKLLKVPPGLIKGIIYSDADYARLSSATVNAGSNLVTWTDVNGEYLMVINAGLASIMTSQAGYYDVVLDSIVIPGGGVVELNVAMSQIMDSDNDGILDDQDDFSDNPAAALDTDGDGQPDEWNAGCDTACQSGSGLTLDFDDDNDGMTDEYEAANGLDPLVDDASGDLDEDGYSNLEEYEAGTNANDPNDVPRRSKALRVIIPFILNQ
jgi:hypothetical protein